jgi:hypothetical protein
MRPGIAPMAVTIKRSSWSTDRGFSSVLAGKASADRVEPTPEEAHSTTYARVLVAARTGDYSHEPMGFSNPTFRPTSPVERSAGATTHIRAARSST